MTLGHYILASLGEWVGTTMFLFLAFGGAKTALFARSPTQLEGSLAVLDNQTIMAISLSFGLALLVSAWVFYRVTGALFNPAITFALWLIGGLTAFRTILLVGAQLLGGITAAALIAGLTPFGGIESLRNTLGVDTSVSQGLFIEAFLTSTLVLTVLLLAAEKAQEYVSSANWHRLGSLILSLVWSTLDWLWNESSQSTWSFCIFWPVSRLPLALLGGTMAWFADGSWLLPLTQVVAGQDADHEDPECHRSAVGAALVRQAVGKVVVFHPKQGLCAGQKEDGSQKYETVRPNQSPVIAIDPNDEAMNEAVRGGEATIVDLGITGLKNGEDEQGAITACSALYGRRGSAFSMRSEGQDLGAMQPPGTEYSGLAKLPIAKAIFQS